MPSSAVGGAASALNPAPVGAALNAVRLITSEEQLTTTATPSLPSPFSDMNDDVLYEFLLPKLQIEDLASLHLSSRQFKSLTSAPLQEHLALIQRGKKIFDAHDFVYTDTYLMRWDDENPWRLCPNICSQKEVYLALGKNILSVDDLKKAGPFGLSKHFIKGLDENLFSLNDFEDINHSGIRFSTMSNSGLQAFREGLITVADIRNAHYYQGLRLLCRDDKNGKGLQALRSGQIQLSQLLSNNIDNIPLLEQLIDNL